MKFVSDIDCSPEHNSWMVEWEYWDGGRWWESFPSEAEMNAALDANKAYNEEHKDDVDAMVLYDETSHLQMLLEYHEDGYPYDTPYWEFLVTDYKERIIRCEEITLPLLNEMKDSAAKKAIALREAA